MLRIGQFTDTFLPIVDGVGRVALAYAETLCQMGNQVTVVTPMYDTGYRGGYPFELVDFQGMSLPGMKHYKQGEAPWDAHYRARMRMIPLDIVHTHSPFTAGSEALRLAAQRKIPLVATFHSKYYDDFLKTTKSEALAKVGVKFVVDFYERCDEVWAVGQATADVLREYGFEGEVQVMPNGVMLRTAEKAAIQEVERRWGLKHDPMILFVGQMNWKKNILSVLEACAMLMSCPCTRSKASSPARMVCLATSTESTTPMLSLLVISVLNRSSTRVSLLYTASLMISPFSSSDQV